MSEDVSKFLMQVKELGDRRIEEDEARSRELEERILRERKEREARRAERARSISPQKSSPANTPPPTTHRIDTHGSSSRLNLDSSPVLEPPASPHTRSGSNAEEMVSPGEFSTSPSKENELPIDLENKQPGQISPTRTGSRARGLSWQRRPNSQTSERSRSRPLSIVAAENAARNPPPEPTSATETISRDQIASALSSKDPSWFRQTADRGANSAAYRRNQVEDNQIADISQMPAQLPGISRAPSGGAPKEDAGSKPTSPDLHSSFASPPPSASTPKTDPFTSETQLEFDISQERSLMSPPSGRTSPSKMDRSGSPTKGMGGFVQSAMMKRSDSIKRWSVQSPSGAPRVDPVASSRISAGPRSRPASIIRDPSLELSPRPSPNPEGERPKEDSVDPEKPSDSLKLDSKSQAEPQGQDPGRTTPPTSPSKTMDSRRWSPTKSSWLESALNKPESPKPKHNPSASQPAWMAELQKAKAEKAANPSAERSRSPTISHKHQVSIGGLMRSSAPGITAKPVGLGVLPPGPSAGTNTRSENSPVAPKELRSPTMPELKSPVLDRKPSESSLPISKPKPDAPPKKDFRANLKPRQPPPTTSGPQDNEFKNVFSNLRKTTTSNYVAPDELKGNILRGKASLHFTGGPKKTERVDEFKEAIQSRRKDFQKAQSEGRGITRNDSTASEQPVPEGLLKRGELGRSNTITQDSPTSEVAGSDFRRPSIVSKSVSPQEPPSSKLQRFGGIDNRDPSPEFKSPKVDPLSMAPSMTRRGSVQPIDQSPITQKDASIPGRLPGKIGGGGLANRFNPALAGLIAKGPPGMGSGSSSSSPSASSSRNPASEVNDNEAGSGPKLTHMTKGRARGPKRKAPTSAASAPSTFSGEQEGKSFETNTSEKPASISPIQPEKASISTLEPQITSPVDSPTVGCDEPARPKLQPVGAAKSFDSVSEDSPSKIYEQVAAYVAQGRQRSPTKTIEEPKETTSQPPSPRKLDMKRMSRFLDDSTQASEKNGEPEPVKDVKKDNDLPPVAKPKPLFDKSTASDAPKSEAQPPPPSKLNKPLPEPLSLERKKQPPAEVSSSSPISSKATATTPSSTRPLPAIPTTAEPELSLRNRPLPAEPKQAPRPLQNPISKSPPETTSPVRSPTKQSYDASTLLNDFFDPERSRKKYNVDAAELLMHRPNVTPTKVQTLKSQLFQFSADGKRLPVPTHHERTLFEREMYLCSHTFKDESGKKVFSEVYFWAGDEVPQSTVEDASVFLPREAKSLAGKLIKLQQGKETPEFLQALGGIVIVQRGSGNKFDSLAPHMLCGRRYLGHVVFDEVDFTPASLCSGFPYVVTTAGRCYIWKGKGSGVDELSCARLIGMDYALSGEMEEVEDGQEPANFWSLFDTKSKPVSADHWRLKPNYDKYCSRLFYSDAASRQQIIEISPFSQVDIQPTGIYVLDAFFELYIIVGSRAQSQYSSFHNALDFAQEYAILAAGMEDRPFVPFSSVVLEGIPRDMKSVFRKWRDANSPTVTNVSTGLKRGRSLRVVPLNQALQALSD
ncbi:uncharacterized protein F4822DRAFT_20771 [Hypoxylon trugodes]|uniref:uncharacterized protein n=1 Tax=Hypoxylon trugodes TaxID=326681 RepID=UPI00218D2B8A|nr:uncharacterized protein F4822DRAFT_20771 [Hypoxylon trugodes]KAI1393686.1 hypothetical protein F4822DRAFT_20771 [Hypoxylon trugodes]